LKGLLKLVLLAKLVSKVLERVVGPTWANRLAFGATVTIGLMQAKAAEKVNKHLQYVVPYYPIVGSLPSVMQNQHSLSDYLMRLARKSNFTSFELIIPGVHMLIAMDPRDREHMLRNHFSNYAKNMPGEFNSFETGFAELFGRGIFAVDGPEWRDHRKIASHLFSGNALKVKMETVFNHHADIFKQALMQNAKENKPFDIQSYFQAIVFDAFCEIAFGISPKAFEVALTGQKDPFLVSFDIVQGRSSERLIQPPWIWTFERLFNIGKERETRLHYQNMREYILPIVKERKRTLETSSGDMLSLYITHAKELGYEYVLEDEYLMDVVANFMVAGRDTTSCSLTNFFKFLSTNNAAEERLLSEIKSSYNGGSVTLETTRTMQFASSCVNEALRLLPPVVADTRFCLHDEDLPSGLKIKRGMQLSLSNYVIGRDPHLWSDPDSFKPERWMCHADKPGGVRRPDEYMLPVFFGGPRLCLGHAMARFEIITFVSKILPELRLTPLPNQNESIMNGPVGFYRDGVMMKAHMRV